MVIVVAFRADVRVPFVQDNRAPPILNSEHVNVRGAFQAARIHARRSFQNCGGFGDHLGDDGSALAVM